jgi:hypothetical protein
VAEEVLAEMLPGTQRADEDRRGAAACAGQALKALDFVAKLRGFMRPAAKEDAESPTEAPIFRVDLSTSTSPSEADS